MIEKYVTVYFLLSPAPPDEFEAHEFGWRFVLLVGFVFCFSNLVFVS